MADLHIENTIFHVDDKLRPGLWQIGRKQPRRDAEWELTADNWTSDVEAKLARRRRLYRSS